jgi:predicted acyltransferase
MSMANAALSTASDPPAARTGTGRLLSLDVFRGVTILAMILVNNPGGGEGYWPLEHAEWHGWTPTDLIFPFFLFIVGTALAYSLRKYRDGAHIQPAVYWRIIRRTLLLIFLGWMPSLLLKTIAAFHGRPFDLDTLRIYGVLVRIALVYFCASMIVLHIPLRGQVVLGILLLLGYWMLLAWHPNHDDYVGNLSNEGNVVGLFDRSTIGPPHMYTYDAKKDNLGEPTEPEGLLSTFPAIVTAMFGYWTGLFIQRRGVNYRAVVLLALCGIALAALGQSWHFIFPINKKIWTSSFVLLTAGLAMIALAVCLTIFDIRGWRRLGRRFEIVGMNAIFVFVCSGLLAIALSRNQVDPPKLEQRIMQTLWERDRRTPREEIVQSVTSDDTSQAEVTTALDRLSNRRWIAEREKAGVETYKAKIKPDDAKINLHRWLYETLWTSWVHDAKLASLCMALTTVAFWWFICWLMSLAGWAIRV